MALRTRALDEFIKVMRSLLSGSGGPSVKSQHCRRTSEAETQGSVFASEKGSVPAFDTCVGRGLAAQRVGRCKGKTF